MGLAVQRRLAFLLAVLVGAFASDAVLLRAESFYATEDFGALSDLIAASRSRNQRTSNSTLGGLRRLEGHVCLFGKMQDRHVDLDCAWKNYISGARLGDSEATFYVAFMLDNRLFQSLSPLEELFPEQGEEVARDPEPRRAAERLKALSKTLVYLAAVGGFPLAMIKLGYHESAGHTTCPLAWKYYSKAASLLLPEFSQPFRIEFLQETLVLTSLDPYHNFDYYAEFESAIRFYDKVSHSLTSDQPKAEWLMWVAHGYMHRGEYETAKNITDEVIAMFPDYADANYVYGIFHYLGVGFPQDHVLAFRYFAKAAGMGHNDALGAVGYMYTQGDGVKRNAILAKSYLTSKNPRLT